MIIIFLFSSVTTFAEGNKKIDSLEAVLKISKPDTNKAFLLTELSRAYFMKSDYPVSRVYGKQALELSMKLNFKRGIYLSHINLGNADLYESKYDLAGIHFLAALKVAEETKNKNFIASSKANLGNYYECKSMLTEALRVLFEALAIYKEIRKENELAGTYLSIANIYSKQGNYAEALKYYFDALKINESSSNKRQMSACYTNIGVIYNKRKEFVKSNQYYEKSLEIDQELRDKFGVCIGYNNIGINYQESGDYVKGLKYSNMAIELSKELGDKYGIGTAAYNIAIINKKQGKYREAEKILYEVNAIGKEIGSNELMTMSLGALTDLYLITGELSKARNTSVKGLELSKETEGGSVLDFYEKLSRVDSALHDYKSAYQNYKMYFLLKDSINNKENERKFTQMEMTHEFSKKEDSLKYVQMRTDNKLREQVIISAKQKTANNYLIAALVLLAVLSFFVYQNYRTRQQLKMQSLRNRIASDLHDDVGSTLSSISIFSQIALEQSKDVAPMVQKIGDYSSNMLDAMADIVWTINPENDQLDKIIMRMRNFAYELLGARQIDFDFKTDDVSNVKLSMDTRKNLFG